MENSSTTKAFYNFLHYNPEKMKSKEIMPADAEKPETPNETFPPHVHDFSSATCEYASQCYCGKINGKPLGHDWNDATCGASEGNPNGHYWTAATLLTPKTCRVCEKTEGDVLSAAGVYNAETTYSGGSAIKRTIYLNEDGSYKFCATGQEAWIGTWRREGVTIYTAFVTHPGTLSPRRNKTGVEIFVLRI